MKFGHSRNLFYVSRSCFSFYLHTFVTHLNKWNTREISFSFDIWKLLVAYKHTYFVQRNRMKCGHSRNLFYAFRSVFHLVYPLLWRNKINQIRGEISFSFDIWKLLVADGGGRPAASAGSAARPAAGGGRPGQRGVPTLAAAADSERWTSAAARLVRCVNSSTALWLYWAVSHHRMCRYGSLVISLRTIWLFMWSSSCTCFE